MGSTAGGDHEYRIISHIIMATSTQKRPRMSNGNDSSEDEQTDTFSASTGSYLTNAVYVTLESENPENKLTDLSPFVIEKTIEGTIGTPQFVKKLKNGNLLVKTSRKSQTENLLKMTKFFNIDVKARLDTKLNYSKGVIKDPMLKGVDTAEIQENLTNQGVTNVKRFTVKRDGKTIETNTLLLDFKTPIPPKELKIFYRLIHVEPYIPNPLRCYKCQKFGHHESKCRATNIRCSNCSENHDNKDCTNQSKCSNCGEAHPSSSNKCTVWQKEKEIVKIKYTNHISFPEARKQYERTHLHPEAAYSTIVKSSQPKVTLKHISTQCSSEEIEKELKQINKQTKKTTPAKQTNQSSQKKQTQTSDKEKQKSSSASAQGSRKKITERLPKGFDDPIKQANKFELLLPEEMDYMEDDPDPPDKNKGGRSPIHPPE